MVAFGHGQVEGSGFGLGNAVIQGVGVCQDYISYLVVLGRGK